MTTNLTNLVKSLRDIMRSDPGINGDAQRIEQIAWLLFLKVYAAKEEEWEIDMDDYQSVIPEKYRWQNWAVDDGSGSARTGDELLTFVDEMFAVLKSLPVTSEMEKKKQVVRSVFEDTNQYMKNGVLLRQVVNLIAAIDLTSYENIHALGAIYETILKELQSAGKAGEFYTPRAVTDFMAEMVHPRLGERMADFACGTGGFLVSYLEQIASARQTPEDFAAYSRAVYGIEKKQFPYELAITNLLLHDVDEPNIIHGNSLAKNVLNYTEKDQFDVILMNPPYGGSELPAIQQNFPEDLRDSETADLFMSVILYRLRADGRAAVVLPDGFLFGTEGTKRNIKERLMDTCNLHTVIRLPASVFSPYTSITTNLLFFDKTGPTEKTWFYRLDMPAGYKHFSKTKPMRREHFDPVRTWWTHREEIEEGGTPKAKCYSREEIAAGGYSLDLCGYPHESETILPPLALIQSYQEERQKLTADIDATLEEIRAALEAKA